MLAELILDLKIIQPDKNNYAARVRCQQPYNSVHFRQGGGQSGADSTRLGVARP